MSMNFNANNILPYGTQLSKVSPDIQAWALLIGSRILHTPSHAMKTADIAAVPLITSSVFQNLNLLPQILLPLLFVTAHSAPGGAGSSAVTVNEDKKTKYPLLRPHVQNIHLQEL